MEAPQRGGGMGWEEGGGLSFSNCLDATQTDATSRVIKSLLAWTPAGILGGIGSQFLMEAA